MFCSLFCERIELIPTTAENINRHIASFKGEKAVLLNIWALWCAPCVKEMPDLKELSTKLNDSIILFINQDSSKDNQEVETFIEKIREFEKKYPEEKNVPRPPHWSGWRLLPDEIEFWLDGEGRIHERLNYKKEKGKWEKELLYP